MVKHHKRVFQHHKQVFQTTPVQFPVMQTQCCMQTQMKTKHFSVVHITDAVPTLPKMMAQIPVHTPTVCDDDDGFLPDLADTNPATPVHTERTLSAAQILADLADGGAVSGHDESTKSLQLQLEVSTTSEQQAKDAEEVDVVNTQEVDVENTQYEDQTMEASNQI